MKKSCFCLTVILIFFAFTGCESNSKVNQETPQGMESVLPGQNLPTSEQILEEESEEYIISKKYIGKNVDELIEVLGEPKSREYTHSCLGDGEDGNLEYEGFFVYTYKEKNIEIVKDIYK